MAISGQRKSDAGAYRISVRGRLTDRFAASFEGMTIHPGDATTVLAGSLRDQSHLMGILRAIDALGLELVSVTPAPVTDAGVVPNNAPNNPEPRSFPPTASDDIRPDASHAPARIPTERVPMSPLPPPLLVLRRRVAALGAVMALLVVVGISAAPALASSASFSSPLLGSPFAGAAAHSRTVQTAGEPAVCASCTPPLTYHGGTIMGTVAQAGQITVTPIYWAPSGFSFSSDYTTVVNQYITDIAAASGTTKNVYAVNQEYYRAPSPAGGDQIRYAIAAKFAGPGGTALTDATPYPAASSSSGCAPTAAFRAAHPGAQCVTDTAVRTELSKLLAANSLPTGLGNIYTIFFPPNVDIVGSDGSYSDQSFCGIHGWYPSTTPAGPVVYSEEPYTISGCYKGQYPQYWAVPAYGQGALDADSAIGTLSHEINEAITDPGVNNAYGWYDSTGHEIGDECSGIFGAPLGSTNTSSAGSTQASEYNQIINGHFYWTQETFSNATFAAFKTGQVCVQKAFQPAGSDSPTLPAPDLGTGHVVAQSNSLPADGVSTTSVSVTVSLQNGEPVVGDQVDFTVRATDGSTGTCGTLSSSDNTTVQKPDGNIGGLTDANGQTTVTYTASSDNVSCDVIASEARGGTSDFATINQGTSALAAPSITAANFPTAITAGAATPVTFTTTSSNPGASDIAGALVTIYLTGDNAGTVGLDASQVNLSYSDSSTGGQFVTVPVTGTTINDGVISGTTLPATGSTLAAGTSRTTTWHLSLVGGAPGSAATKPLILEADLDQIDAASGAYTNLSYTNTSLTAIPGSTVTPPVVTPTTITYFVVLPTKTIVQTVPVKANSNKCTVPRLVGQTLARTKARLKKAHCTSVTLIEPTHTKHQKLVVKSASPKAGTHLSTGGTLTVKFHIAATKGGRHK